MKRKNTLKKILIAFTVVGFNTFTFGQLLEEGFEGAVFPPTGWTTMDLDGVAADNWAMYDAANGFQPEISAIEGSQFAGSLSWLNQVFQPDNWLISPQLNITDPSTTLSFKSMSNYGDYMGVYISTTGTSEADFGTAILEQNFSDSWENFQFPLSSYVGQNIYIAFRHFNCTDLFVMAIDDIKVSVPEPFDLSLSQVQLGSAGYWNYVYYPTVPVNQIAPVDFDGIITNSGSTVQNDVVFNVTSTGYTGASDVTTLNTFQTDTISILNAYTPPSTIGVNTLNFSVSSGATDSNPADNTLPAKTINVNEFQYACDLGVIDGNLWNPGGIGFEVGNIFNIYNTDTLYSALVNINSNTKPGLGIFVRLYEMDTTATTFLNAFVEVFSNQNSYIVTTSDADNWVKIQLEEPQLLVANKSYALVVGYAGDNPGDTIGFVCNSSGESANSTNCYLDYGDGEMYITGRTAMVRMDFERPFDLSINENNANALSIYPNPSNGTFTISADKLATYETVELMDQVGRVVGTWKVNGSTLNITTKNVAKGNYNLVVRGQNGALVQKVMID